MTSICHPGQKGGRTPVVAYRVVLMFLSLFRYDGRCCHTDIEHHATANTDESVRTVTCLRLSFYAGMCRLCSTRDLKLRSLRRHSLRQPCTQYPMHHPPFLIDSLSSRTVHCAVEGVTGKATMPQLDRDGWRGSYAIPRSIGGNFQVCARKVYTR